MATEFFTRLRAATQHALGLTTAGTLSRADPGDPTPAVRSVFPGLASRSAELVRANASWQPTTHLIRVEIMASGPFDSLRGIRKAVNRLQNDLVSAARKSTLE